MKLLALDTSTDACSAALWLDGDCVERFDVVPRGHTDLILPMVESLFAEAELDLGQVDAIAFARGPGAFTGVRIASGVVQGLAYARDLPVVPVSTLAALAQQGWRLTQWTQVIACLDARMGEVYWGGYQYIDSRMQAIELEERVCPPAQAPLPQGHAWHGIGSGWQEYQAELRKQYEGIVQAWDATCYPHAQDIAELASFAVRAGETLAAGQALPVYLRDRVVHGQ